MSTYTYPHTIENGAAEQITFVRRVLDPAGDRLEVESLVKPGSEPSMHVHNYQLPPEGSAEIQPRRLSPRRRG